MYEVTRLVSVSDPQDDVAVAGLIHRVKAVAHRCGADRVVVARTLPGTRNGGDVVIHLGFDSAETFGRHRPEIDAVTSGVEVVGVNGAEYEAAGPGLRTSTHAAGRRHPLAPATIYRALLLRVDADARPHQIEAFERATLTMPDHVTSMQAWQLSPVAVAVGDSEWTHIWEQEFTDLDGLTGQYMNHPIHWGLVDGWFDPESPECIITARVCHSFCTLKGAAIGIEPPRLAAAES